LQITFILDSLKSLTFWKMPPFGARRGRPEPVIVNVYDLQNPQVNDLLFPLGLGIYHSGIAVHGTEYTFGSGGGIFSHEPKAAPSARFRCSIVLGEVDADSREVESIVESLRSEWPGSRYHVMKNNCNSFSLELGRRLTGRAVPGWINRLSAIGNAAHSACSCLLPDDSALGNSPVGGGSSSSSSSSSSSQSSSVGGAKTTTSFSGTGYVVGGGSGSGSAAVSTTSSTGGRASREIMLAAALKRTQSASVSSTNITSTNISLSTQSQQQQQQQQDSIEGEDSYEERRRLI